MDASRTATAFSLQSERYDLDDRTNPVLPGWRQRVYRHVESHLRPGSAILELNAGTGIDALHFVSKGFRVHATDASQGMITQLKSKIEPAHAGRLTAQQLGYEELGAVEGTYDCVFSNFGGLNCIQDLTRVTNHLPRLLRPGGTLVWVIMPPGCLWEWGWIFKGSAKAFRRLSKKGSIALVEGEPFIAFYHSQESVSRALGPRFHLAASEGLGCISPPPASIHFIKAFPRLTSILTQWEKRVSCHFPFNRWADHLIMTFRFNP